MRHLLFTSCFFILTICVSSCATKTQTGALTGASMGTGIGALADGERGALIGGALGALTGAVIGDALDQKEEALLRQQSPQTLQRLENKKPLSLEDIIALSRVVNDQVVISQIRQSSSSYQLSTLEIIRLREEGVSNRVIDYMINTNERRN